MLVQKEQMRPLRIWSHILYNRDETQRQWKGNESYPTQRIWQQQNQQLIQVQLPKTITDFFNGGNTTSNSAKQTIQFIFFTIKSSKVNSLFLLTEVKICFKIRNKKHNNKKSPVMILSDHVLHPPPRSSSPASVSQLIDRQSAFLPQLWTQCIVSLPQGGNFICGSCSSTYKYLEIATKPLSSSPLTPQTGNSEEGWI